MTTQLRLTACGLGLLACFGCASDNPRGSSGGAPMTASGELANPNPKPMDAQAAFFAGQIEVEAMLAKSDVAWKSDGSNSAEGRGRSGRGGGFGGGGGRRGGGRGMGGGGSPSAGGEGAPRDEASRGPAIRASNAPAVQLKLRLTNHGAAAAEVQVLDFNSDLGNFVVQPATMALPPGETTEAEPMTSRLGVPAVEEIPVTVRLRVGGKTGTSETQVLKLKPRAEEPTATTK